MGQGKIEEQTDKLPEGDELPEGDDPIEMALNACAMMTWVEAKRLRTQQKGLPGKPEGGFAPNRIPQIDKLTNMACKNSHERRQLAKKAQAEILELPQEKKVEMMLVFFRSLPLEHRRQVAIEISEILDEAEVTS